MLLRLWRELHPNDPVQLQLTFRKAGKSENSKGSLEEVSVKVLPLLAWRMLTRRNAFVLSPTRRIENVSGCHALTARGESL
jgi:hypothetical protein